MARIKYTPGGERRRFQQRGQGLRAGEQRIQEQAQIGIDAMKLAALRQEKLDNQFISGLTSKHNFEEGVLREKQELENKARTRKYEAFQKFADTDVARMEGKAKDLEKKAEFWKDFAPKFAKNLGKLAEGAWYIQDRVKGIAREEDLRKAGFFDKLTDGIGDTSYGLETNMNLDREKLRKEGNFPLSNQLGKIINGNSHWLSLRIAKFVSENRELIRDDIIASFGKNNYTAENAVEVQTFGMYQIMEKIGISPRSAGGRKLLDQATNVGLIDRRNIIATKEAGETASRIEVADQDLEIALKAWVTNPTKDNYKQVQAKLHTQTGHHLDGTFIENGQIDSPNSGPRNKGVVYNKVLENIINQNYKWMTREQVQNLTALAVPSFNGEQTEAYNKKFPISTNELLERYDKLKRDQDSKADNLQIQKSINRMNEINTKYNEKYKDKPPSKYDKFKLVNEVMRDPLLRDTQKTEILSNWGVDYEDLKDVPYIALIHNYIVEGNTKEVVKLLNSKEIEPAQKIRILRQVDALTKLQNLGPLFAGSTKPGILSYFEDADNVFNGLQEVYPGTSQGQGLTASGVIAKNDYKSFAVETYLAAIDKKDGKGMSEKEAVIHTKEILDKEWKDGAHPTDKGKLGTGRFARKLATVDGKKVWLFPRHMDIDSRVYANFTNELDDDEMKGEGDWMTLTEAGLIELLSKDPDSIMTDSYTNVNEIITHNRLTNKKEMVWFGKQLENWRLNHSSTKGGDIMGADFDIPKGFHVVADYLGMNVVDVVNKWIAEHEKDPKWSFLEDVRMPKSTDEKNLLQHLRDDKTHGRNDVGAKYVNDIKQVSGTLPKKKEIWEYLENLESGVDRNTALINLFQNRTKITWEEVDGNFVFSDTNGYLANGGLDLPTNADPSALLNSLGFDPQSLITKYDQRVIRLKKRKEFWDSIYKTLGTSYNTNL